MRTGNIATAMRGFALGNRTPCAAPGDKTRHRLPGGMGALPPAWMFALHAGAWHRSFPQH